MMIDKFQGEEYVMHRYGDGPIITVEDFPLPARRVFNCGQTTYNGKTVLLIAAEYKEEINGSITGIHLAMSDDGVHFDIEKEPFCAKRDWTDFTQLNCDNWVIDPRITKIDDTYYIVRPAQIQNVGPSAILEKTKDFKTLEFVESIALPNNRVPCLFPEKIDGMYVRLDRPYSAIRLEDRGGHSLDDLLLGGMWVSYSPDLVFWGKHRPIFYPPLPFANYKVGPTPPIKTKDGWLEIIHGVYKENREWCYSLSAILLDLKDPTKVLSVLQKPILTPNRPYEIDGLTKNVVFSCGAVVNEEKDEIRIYYGACDECIGLAIGSLNELLDELRKNKLQ